MQKAIREVRGIETVGQLRQALRGISDSTRVCNGVDDRELCMTHWVASDTSDEKEANDETVV
jgi:hypothetical protein